MLHLVIPIKKGRIKTDAGAFPRSSVALSVWPGYTLGQAINGYGFEGCSVHAANSVLGAKVGVPNLADP